MSSYNLLHISVIFDHLKVMHLFFKLLRTLVLVTCKIKTTVFNTRFIVWYCIVLYHIFVAQFSLFHLTVAE